MWIGLDLDGTVVVYEEVFHRIALQRLGMPAEVPVLKNAVRSWVRRLPGGETQWIKLQRLAYGPLMLEARPAPGIRGFLRGCNEAGISVSIISHRTSYSVARPRVDLHAAATDWLEQNGFFSDEGLGLRRDRVFLETTRAAKLARIGSEGCVLFVDDLEEVLGEPSFPASVEKWLYAPGEPGRRLDGMHVFSDWSTVLQRALDLRRTAGG